MKSRSTAMILAAVGGTLGVGSSLQFLSTNPAFAEEPSEPPWDGGLRDLKEMEAALAMFKGTTGDRWDRAQAWDEIGQLAFFYLHDKHPCAFESASFGSHGDEFGEHRCLDLLPKVRSTAKDILDRGIFKASAAQISTSSFSFKDHRFTFTIGDEPNHCPTGDDDQRGQMLGCGTTNWPFLFVSEPKARTTASDRLDGVTYTIESDCLVLTTPKLSDEAAEVPALA